MPMREARLQQAKLQSDRYPAFAEMAKALLEYGFVHFDDERDHHDGNVVARKYRFGQRFITLGKDETFEARVEGRTDGDVTGCGQDALKDYLKGVFASK